MVMCAREVRCHVQGAEGLEMHLSAFSASPRPTLGVWVSVCSMSARDGARRCECRLRPWRVAVDRMACASGAQQALEERKSALYVHAHECMLDVLKERRSVCPRDVG